MSLAIGQKVVRIPGTFDHYDIKTNRHSSRPMVGYVTYIHPKGHYHSVAFELLGGTVVESFLGVCE